MSQDTISENVRELVAYLQNTGTGQDKIDAISAVIAERPEIGAVELVDLIDADGVVPAATVSKARAWLDDPSLTAPPRPPAKSQAQLMADALRPSHVDQVDQLDTRVSRLEAAHGRPGAAPVP